MVLKELLITYTAGVGMILSTVPLAIFPLSENLLSTQEVEDTTTAKTLTNIPSTEQSDSPEGNKAPLKEPENVNKTQDVENVDGTDKGTVAVDEPSAGDVENANAQDPQQIPDSPSSEPDAVAKPPVDDDKDGTKVQAKDDKEQTPENTPTTTDKKDLDPGKEDKLDDPKDQGNADTSSQDKNDNPVTDGDVAGDGGKPQIPSPEPSGKDYSGTRIVTSGIFVKREDGTEYFLTSISEGLDGFSIPFRATDEEWRKIPIQKIKIALFEKPVWSDKDLKEDKYNSLTDEQVKQLFEGLNEVKVKQLLVSLSIRRRWYKYHENHYTSNKRELTPEKPSGSLDVKIKYFKDFEKFKKYVNAKVKNCADNEICIAQKTELNVLDQDKNSFFGHQD